MPCFPTISANVLVHVMVARQLYMTEKCMSVATGSCGFVQLFIVNLSVGLLPRKESTSLLLASPPLLYHQNPNAPRRRQFEAQRGIAQNLENILERENLQVVRRSQNHSVETEIVSHTQRETHSREIHLRGAGKRGQVNHIGTHPLLQEDHPSPGLPPPAQK